ncbi:MAG TPA: cupin domain-containing protein [Burkholderiales bacterium]|jgi:quercetin dioxygenase-like cupin family protein
MKIHHLSLEAAVVLAGTLAICVIPSYAADKYSVTPASELQWADTGPQFPNTHVVILNGDPGKKNVVALRWRCPSNYKFLPHTHPGTERVTVLSGTILLAIGEKYESAKLTEVGAGGYFVIPAKAPHYGECVEETVLEIHTPGPLGTTYVNPADDPSKKM